ncbi:MAG: class I SAM-dependent methyltransferase [Pseudomonadota bacterium]
MVNWDRKYLDAGAGKLFGDRVCPYVRFVLQTYCGGAKSALCLADGDGRNGRWLAGQGLSVTGIDLSDVATGYAAQGDAAAGVDVERICGDLASWDFPHNRTWDAVFMMYLQCEADVRMRALQVGWSALGPGGVLAIEGFAQPSGPQYLGGGIGQPSDQAQLQASTSPGRTLGPGDHDLLYRADVLGSALDGAEILELLNGRVRLDDGLKHQGSGHIIRFCARKP